MRVTEKITYNDFYQELLKNKALKREGDDVYYTLEDDEIVERPVRGGRPLIIYEDTFSFFLADIGNGEVDFDIYDPTGT